GGTGCYDPSFAAGYPRSSSFDGEARPFVLALAAGGTNPAAYKLCLALGWWLAPLATWAAARLVRCGGAAATLAAGLAVLLAGTAPGRRPFADGDLGLVLSAAAAVLHLACLVRCHARPDVFGWVGLLATAGA